MGFFHKIGNALYRFMYGRNGMDRLNLALVWVSLILDLAAVLTGRKSALISGILYYTAIAVWGWVLFRTFSKNVYRRREENGRYLTLLWKIKSRGSLTRERRSDKAHRYFTCKNCKTVCRVPVGKGKIVITCPKCGAQIRGKT